jgi:alcohol dehydrogenase (cytochrome c)
VKALVHFDRNGFGYTLNRETGELLVAEKFDPAVNWATKVDMQTGRPQVVSQYSTQANGEDKNSRNICPAALGSKDQQPAAFSPRTNLFYVPTNHVCMDYEPFKVSYTAGQPYVGATLSMFPPQGQTNLGNFIAWDAGTGKIAWSKPEPFSVWSGALATAGDVVFYGTLDRWFKAVDAKSGKLLWQIRTPSGIIGQPISYWGSDDRQYVAILSGVGGWPGVVANAEVDPRVRNAALGFSGAMQDLPAYTAGGSTLMVFALPREGSPQGGAPLPGGTSPGQSGEADKGSGNAAPR